jgi:hypothetical protein
MLNAMKHLLRLASSACVSQNILRYAQNDNFFNLCKLYSKVICLLMLSSNEIKVSVR